jgi:hypothetical protein
MKLNILTFLILLCATLQNRYMKLLTHREYTLVIKEIKPKIGNSSYEVIYQRNGHQDQPLHSLNYITCGTDKTCGPSEKLTFGIPGLKPIKFSDFVDRKLDVEGVRKVFLRLFHNDNPDGENGQNLLNNIWSFDTLVGRLEAMKNEEEGTPYKEQTFVGLYNVEERRRLRN